MDLSYNSSLVKEFEDIIAKHTGAKYVLATNSGTSALHLALLCNGITTGSRVITSPISFVATPNAISYCGATPIFHDVDNDGCLAPFKIKYLNISAIVPVWLYGKQPDIKGIKKIADIYGCPIIEDAAQALGYWKPINKEYTAILSFNGNKIITTGGGGALLTSNKKIYERALYLSTQAKNYDKKFYFHNEIGYNYRLPGLNAKHGIKEIKKLNYYIKYKKKIEREPYVLLSDLPMYKDCLNDGLPVAKKWVNENKGWCYVQ